MGNDGRELACTGELGPDDVEIAVENGLATVGRVRFGTPCGLKSDIEPSPRRARSGSSATEAPPKNAGTSVEQIERFYARNLPLSPELAKNLQSFGES